MKIEKTTNYDKFNTLRGNRPKSEAHVRNIMKSMQHNFLIRPIDVNGNMEIIDGQHRHEACKRLGYPVYYVVHKSWGLEHAHTLNANQKNWTLDHYIDGYCNKGLTAYKTFKELKNKYKLSHTLLLSLVNKLTTRVGGTRIQQFRDGKLQIIDLEWAEMMAERIVRVGQYHECNKSRLFALSLIRILETTEMDFEVFMNKLQYKAKDLDGCSTEKQYLRVIEDIYNWKNRNKVRLF